jgi:hypothetical protein
LRMRPSRGGESSIRDHQDRNVVQLKATCKGGNQQRSIAAG